MPITRIRQTLAFVCATTLVATLLALSATPAGAAPNGYVEMSDGTLIAINVKMPKGFKKGHSYPAILQMSGYDGGSATGQTLAGDIADAAGYEGDVPLRGDGRQFDDPFDKHYVTVQASVRGTGCSGGEFDLFSWRSALDGREVVEWMARQPWSNGKVGILGHSYSGITGFMIAATQPPPLVAMHVSGLIDDLYRGITFPGGVSNLGFPLLWTGAVRPAYDIGGGTAPGIVRTQDPICIQNQATHRRTVVEDPIVNGATTPTDSNWWRSRSLATYAHLINVPIHITGAYQDEQTGPRGPAHLWELVRGVPKRLILTNGDHGTNTGAPEIWADRVAWTDHWIRGIDGGFGSLKQDKTSVTTLFEMSADDHTSNGRKDSKTFPLEDTKWTDFYLREGGALATAKPKAGEASDIYVSGPGRHSWSYQAGPTSGAELTTPEGPDEVNYRSPILKKNTAIVGPILARLFISSTLPDHDIFVSLVDEAPDGSLTYLQRGMLRASHRALNLSLSDWVRRSKPVLYRPYHPHVNPVNLTPMQTYEYVVEVFPVGHVFRKGHRILLKVHGTPLIDSYYMYPYRHPGVQTILHDAEYPSRIMLPIVPLTGVKLGRERACGEQDAVRCIPG